MPGATAWLYAHLKILVVGNETQLTKAKKLMSTTEQVSKHQIDNISKSAFCFVMC